MSLTTAPRPWWPSAFLAGALAFVMLLAASGSVVASADDETSHVPVQDPLYGIASVVPESWQSLGSGIHARGMPPEDVALILMQSAPIPNEDLWPRLLPQVGQSEVPAQTGSLSTDAFEWSFHAIDLDLQARPLSVEVALAEDDGSSYLIIFQSAADEFEGLREAVFLPAVEAYALLEAAPTADPATLGYALEEVRFDGGAEGVRLAGTLSLPPGPGPHPAMVLMSGSGQQDRDESLDGIATIKPFALIADALTAAGVGVLRYDDRGAGESTGQYSGATIGDLTEDGASALDYLASRDDIDPARIGLLGHSEGGIYATRIAARDPRVALVVMVAGPAVDGASLLIEQTEALARSSGEAEADVVAVRAFADAAMPAVLEGDEEAVEAASRELYETIWDNQSEDGRTVLGPRDVYVDRQAELQVQLQLSDWYHSLVASDPRPDLALIEVPILALYGGLDMQVLSSQNEPAFMEATAGNTDATAVVLPDANHLFQAAETGAIIEYGTLADEFTADFLPTLVDWVVARSGVE